MSLNDDITLLARQPLLGLMDRDALRLVAFAAESRTLRAGDVLFRRGEGSDGAFLIVSGAVALKREDDGGPADEIVGPGALIGELA
uniref:cyclic nucleotide-binding domain-containing protein n=1 Tax=Streptomyces niveiscabiei TaxID=164115 RepID=UPI0038F70540